jgi:Protein phosphatase 2C
MNTLSDIFLGLLVVAVAAIAWLAVAVRRKPQVIQGPERVVEIPGPVREVKVEVPGPERIVYRDVPGPVREVKVEVPGPVREVKVEVPGPERIVYRDPPAPEPLAAPAIATIGGEPRVPVSPRALPLGLDATPDSIADGADLGPLLIRAASIRGDRNRLDARFRGDAFLLHAFEGRFPRPVLLSVVAEGMGYGGWASAGADRLCRSLATALDERAGGISTTWSEGSETNVLHNLLRSATQAAVLPLRELAKIKNTPLPTEFTAVLTPLGDVARRQHLIFGVGRGMVWRVRGDNWEVPYPAPDSSPSSASLPDEPEAVTWATVETEPGNTLLLCTGSMGKLTQRKLVQDFLTKAWSQGTPHLTEFLWQMTFRAPTAMDDRTVIGLWDYGTSAAVREPEAP